MSEPRTDSPPALEDLLRALDGTPATYLGRARQIQAAAAERNLRPASVAILATFTTEILGPYLRVEGIRRGLRLEPRFLPFGQIEQPILDPSSALYQGSVDAIVIAIGADHSVPALFHDFVRTPADGVRAAIADHVERIAAAVGSLRDRSAAKILLWNQTPARLPAAGFADLAHELPQADAIVELNRRLARLAASFSDVHVFDAHRVATELGLSTWFDDKLAHVARIPLSGRGQIAAAAQLARQVSALLLPPRKCLVLDLDNTLWGGVLGEDGLGGIAIGEDYPGSVFRDFQRMVRTYRDRGILLAIASKNNEGDVLEAFERHPSMVLRLDDFSARQIHWNDKASSLVAIAKELNIGLDSLVFFDDNPVERDWVASQLPEVKVIEVPKEPLRYADALDAAGAFDVLTITEEDRARVSLYRHEKGRQDLLRNATTPEEFIASLQMKLTIGNVDSMTCQRVVQLLRKTNQFNVTTRRHDQADLDRMAAANALALWIRVEDRFGDSGLVGVAIAVERAPGTYEVDSLLLSCRVLGRRVEHTLLAFLARQAIARGARWLEGVFIPTAKNAPAADLYRDFGFEPVSGKPGHWLLDLARPLPGVPAGVELVDATRPG